MVDIYKIFYTWPISRCLLQFQHSGHIARTYHSRSFNNKSYPNTVTQHILNVPRIQVSRVNPNIIIRRRSPM